MFEVRIHGRGGQGVVTAAELLSLAAFEEGHHVQAFPSFGSERTGAPVISYCRISDNEIRTREPILAPDALIVQDATLLHQVDVFSGLKPEGYVVINSTKTPTDLGLEDLLTSHKPERIITVPATDLAKKHIGRPVPNAVLLGALAALTQKFKVVSIEHALGHKFSGKVKDGNAAAAAAAYEHVAAQLAPAAAAATPHAVASPDDDAAPATAAPAQSDPQPARHAEEPSNA